MLKTKTSFSRVIGLTMAFLMILSCMPVMNAEAKMTTGTNSFFEDFEGYLEAATVGTTSINYNGWTTTHVAGTPKAGYKKLSTVSSENAAKGNALRIDHTDSATSILALGKSSGITIGSDDIIISGDVYVPAPTAAPNKQFVRFYVARGTAHKTPAFGFYITKYDNRSDWYLRQVAPITTNSVKEDELKDENATNHALDLKENTWYNLACVYHPATKSVDYYVDGTYFGSTDTLGYDNTGAEGVYQVFDNNVGESLGDIVVAAGALDQGTDATAAKFDNISVTTASASNVRYSDIENGSSYLNARFDVPVNEATIADENITVTKMAADDVTFSGANATEVTGYTVNYKDAGGVGIQMPSALTTAYDRYQVKVTGMTDIFGNPASATYNCTVGDGVIVTTLKEDTFDSGITAWTNEVPAKVTLSHDATNSALSASVTAAAINYISNTGWNQAISANIDYIDVTWDMKATYSSEYKSFFALRDANSNTWGPGICVQHTNVYLLGYNSDGVGMQYEAHLAGNRIESDKAYSFRFRYYPEGRIVVYTASTQADLDAATPLLDVTDATRYAWPSSNPALDGFILAPIKASTTTLFDNFSVKTYGYSAVEYEIAQQQTFSETFDSGANNWMEVSQIGNVTVEHDANALKATANARLASNIIRRYATADVDNNNYCNITVNDAVEYMDVSWDINARYGNSGQAESYKTWFEILTGTNSAQAVKVGLNVQNNLLQILGSGHAAGSSDATKGIAENTWTSYKLRYYPWTGKVEVYTAASQSALASTTEPVLTQTAETYKWSTTDNGTRIFGFQFIPINNGSVTLFDNFSVTTYGYALTGATVKAATFEDKNGNVLDNKAGAKTIKLHLDNADTAPTVSLSGRTLSGATYTDGVYTATIDTALAGSTDYTLTVGSDSYTFTTGAGKFGVSNLRFVDGSGETVSGTFTSSSTLYAKVDAFNTTATDETAYLIWAAYKGTQLESISYTPISAVVGYDDSVTGTYSLAITTDTTNVKAFVWDGFTTLVPLIESVTLNAAAAN